MLCETILHWLFLFPVPPRLVQTLAADFNIINIRAYRGYAIAKAVSKYSRRQGWVFAHKNREVFAKTLKQAKVMIDCAIEL